MMATLHMTRDTQQKPGVSICWKNLHTFDGFTFRSRSCPSLQEVDDFVKFGLRFDDGHTAKSYWRQGFHGPILASEHWHRAGNGRGL